MSQRLLDAVLAGTHLDPDTGKPAKVGVRSVVIEPSLAGIEGDLIESLDIGRDLAVVTDPRTHAVLGARVEAAVRKLGRLVHIEFTDAPHADDLTVGRIRAATAKADALIAVGSGTINDLCKYAGALDRKPYAVFGTAPSMNGFTSANAAITVRGHKKSLPAQEPRGVFLDLTVLAGAPKRLIRSGLGDSVCRATAQTDWLLSHILLGTPYRQVPFDLLREDEAGLFAEPGALVSGDIAAMARLARTLVLSGFGMTIAGGSHPASQGEHLIGHYIEMMAPEHFPKSFHGEQIAVATLHMAAMQERILAGPPPRLAPTTWRRIDLEEHFGPELGASCWLDFRRKALDEAAASALEARIEGRWSEIQARLAAATRPEAEIRAALTAAGAPTAPRDLGWSDDFFATAARHARLVRDRYTFLDLAGDARLPAPGPA